MSTMDEIEEESKAAAEKMVMNMMQRPGQLEKVEQYKKRITHKKASIEAQLKSAVQGKLDGVSVGLRQLQECLDDVQQINLKMDELEELLQSVPPLVASLQAVREEDSRHSQYVTAMDSLKHIFTVPESVAKTNQWIGEGKLLHAHQCLSDLENSRDDLLYELHRLPNQSSHDKIMLKAYFEDVEMVSNLLEKQIKLILERTLNTVRKEPTVIVTALRIIEREEKRDQMALQQQDQSGFMPPGRPKNWRTKAFEVLERVTAQRVEGTRVDEREDNKLWLIRYLELTRQLILEDLMVVKTLCVPCFPPHYDIVNKYVNMYHTCLSTSLQDIVQNGLEGNEYVTLLSWILNTYPGPELMGSPKVNVDVSTLPPLLSDEMMQKLQDEYLQKMESNYMEWMEKTLESERAEWAAERSPEVEPHTNAFHTHAPVIIFQMIDQNLQVTETISKEITFKALLLSIDQVTRYGNMYREGVIQFKNGYFADRSRLAYFTHHMITIVNNCEQMVRLAQQTQARRWPPAAPAKHHPPAERSFDRLLSTFQVTHCTHHMITIVNNCEQMVRLAQQTQARRWPPAAPAKHHPPAERSFDRLLSTFQVTHCTHHMITIVNNCEQMVRLAQQTQARRWPPAAPAKHHPPAERSFDRLLSTFQVTHCTHHMITIVNNCEQMVRLAQQTQARRWPPAAPAKHHPPAERSFDRLLSTFQVTHCTHHMITIVNNCEQMVRLAQQTQARRWPPAAPAKHHPPAERSFDRLLSTFQVTHCTHHMITIVNNCEQMVRLAQQTQARRWPPAAPAKHHPPAERSFDRLLSTFQVTHCTHHMITIVNNCEQMVRLAQQTQARRWPPAAPAKHHPPAERSFDRLLSTFQVTHCTHHMITIVNNCEQMVRLAQQTQARRWPPAAPAKHHPPAERSFDRLLSTFQTLRDEAAKFLLEEAFLDLEQHFDDLFTTKWMTSSIPVDTICVTLDDYFQDYNHLREKNFEYVINEAQNLVYKKYITAMLSKKITFKTVEEAQQAATKIVKEANQIRSFFRKIALHAEGVNVDWPFEVMGVLAEVLRCQDIEMLSLDLHGLLEKCPDVSEEQLVRLLALRGDIPRAPPHPTAPQLFKSITFNDRLLSHFTL
ncbi:exocyst complex component 3 isoform X2 [Bicyclus anynana]|uniref:Exocyst complex component 3 isoform X2 n=1 Tax=Bicyclus anynana TaxID=110368 RepID=A0ABM3LK39_BICAN|nr:exocyst complex component 3 isoform X2 [Bicyclus anynana]